WKGWGFPQQGRRTSASGPASCCRPTTSSHQGPGSSSSPATASSRAQHEQVTASRAPPASTKRGRSYECRCSSTARGYSSRSRSTRASSWIGSGRKRASLGWMRRITASPRVGVLQVGDEEAPLVAHHHAADDALATSRDASLGLPLERGRGDGTVATDGGVTPDRDARGVGGRGAELPDRGPAL